LHIISGACHRLFAYLNVTSFAEKFVPSPMEETFVHAATPIKIQHRTEADISTADVPRTVDQQPPPTQRAELAYYRSNVDQVPSYNL